MSDPVKAIARRLNRMCNPIAHLVLDQSRSEDWHSLLFDGGRHHLDLRLVGEDLDDILRALPSWIAADDFIIAGHLIADMKLSMLGRQAGQASLSLEALTIADRQSVNA
ncbi:MAG: hypothetical protein V4618_01595 [Pseudomonadota bacterium]